MTKLYRSQIAPALFVISLFVVAVVTSACASLMKAEHADELLKSNEFDHSIQVKEVTEEPSGKYVRLPGPEPVAGAFPKPTPRVGKRTKRMSGSKNILAAAPPPVVNTPPPPDTAAALAKLAAAMGSKHEPSIEDGSGYFGRRPAKDPFRVGEKVTLEVSYFSVVAGDMTVEVRNFADVNGRRSYRLAGTAHSTSVFAMFYAIDDWFETFVDYETLIPQSYSLHVKETKQLRETQTVFDWAKHKANYYDKKINEEKKLEQDNKEWDIPDYSQNVFSAAYYLRTFDLRPGFKTQFRVAHEGKNLILGAEYVRTEKITTPAGEFECVVVKPTISLDGKFTPIGDVFVWFTNDERKFIVRIESKIRIGKVVGVAKAIEPGKL